MRPWLLALLLVLMTGGVAAALVTSEESGTGAENVGDDGRAELTAPTPDAPDEAETPAPDATEAPRKNCKATNSNPGGTNNYIPDAPELKSLGEGFVIEGFVRAELSAASRSRTSRSRSGSRPRPAASRTTARRSGRTPKAATGSRRRRRRRSSGSPTSTSAVDRDKRFEPVFIRRVVDLDDKRAVVNLTLKQR